MKKIIEEATKSLDKNLAPNEIDYNSFLQKLDFIIDQDFQDFIKKYDGAEGEIGTNYISFWNVKQLVSMNPYYEDNEACERLLFFATDGSNFGYAFDKSTSKIIGIDFLDLSEYAPDIFAESFELFLNKLSNS